MPVTEVGSFPFYSVTYDKSGTLQGDMPVLDPKYTDVVIVAHGWNNDAIEAQTLFTKLFRNMTEVAPGVAGFPRDTLAVIGVFWPSKKFNFASDDAQARGPAAGIGAGPAVASPRVGNALDDLRKTFAGESDDKQQQIAIIEDLANKRNDEAVGAKLVTALRKLLEDQDTDLLGTDAAALFNSPTQPLVLYEAAKDDIILQAGGQGAVATTPAAGIIGAAAGGIDNAFENLLNVTSYYQMKKRAGKVGAAGVAALISQLAAAPGIKRIHLVGHSFGGRLVTAAAKAASPTDKLHSMTLLQAAFSHNGFSAAGNEGGTDIDEGYFRSVITEKRIKGPILITFSRHDHAVAKAYAIASRISRQNAASLGGPTDPYGGIGANGAQRLGASAVSAKVTALFDKGASYQWEQGKVHNLAGHDFISSHGDVSSPQVAWAIASAIAS